MVPPSPTDPSRAAVNSAGQADRAQVCPKVDAGFVRLRGLFAPSPLDFDAF